MRGATTAPQIRRHLPRYFNPRTPCGVRRRRNCPALTSAHFNPRTPCGVRRGIETLFKDSAANFNPRTPCGVRLGRVQPVSFFRNISIHAPRAGCDRKHVQLGLLLFLQLYQIRCMFAYIILVLPRYFNRKRGFQPFSSVRSAPGIHVRSHFAPRQSISSPSGA